jgi:hypothetical protein
MAIRVGIDQGADLKVLRKLQRQGLIELRQANELEKTFRHVIQQKKALMFDYSKWDGPDVFADEKVNRVEDIVGLDKRGRHSSYLRVLPERLRVFRYREHGRLHQGWAERSA